MRQRLIRLHFHHFWINDDETHLFRREAKEHAGNQRIDTDALSAASRPRDKQMRHLRQVGNDCLAVNVLAEGERNFCVFLR